MLSLFTKSLQVDGEISQDVRHLRSFQRMLKSDPVVSVTLENARDGDLMPSVPEMSRFWYSFQSALKYSANGRQTVDDALETAAMRISQ